MSPIGGVGINLAIQDAVAAANVLAAPLAGDGPWPLVVDLHGGPINGLRFGRQPRLERWVGAGFAAFAPEHRESGIAGEDAMLAALGCRDEPPGLSAARDVLGGVEEVVRRGVADPVRLCLFGYSAGANLAGRLVAADHRFRAAVCWEGVGDWRLAFGVFGGSDHARALLGGSPWQAPERYRAASPVARVAEVRTPTLLLYGDAHGSPFQVADAVAWYTALREHGVEAELVLYRGEGHWMRRPENQEDLFARSVAWFRRHGA
jgi:dipeptidyl aminopeptidase/acylaminoacyl peptidase